MSNDLAVDQGRHQAAIEHAARLWEAAREDADHWRSGRATQHRIAYAKAEAVMETIEELLVDLLGLDITIVRGSLKEGLL